MAKPKVFRLPVPFGDRVRHVLFVHGHVKGGEVWVKVHERLTAVNLAFKGESDRGKQLKAVALVMSAEKRVEAKESR